MPYSADSLGFWRRPRRIPLSKCKFVAESLAKGRPIRDCLSTASGGCTRGGSALTGTHTTAVDQTTGQDGATRAKGGPVIEIDHVTKRFGDFVAVDEARLRHRVGRVLLAARPVGLRQDHDAADDRRLRDPDRGRDPARGRRRLARAAAQAQRQHGVPALRAVPAHDGGGQRRLRAAQQEDGQGRGHASGVDELLELVRLDRLRRSASPPSCPAASSSASRWPARWSTTRARCCSTSRSARSTSSCARRCSSSSSASSARSGSRSST